TFRWKGENVATAEIAELLNGAPGVSETAVYGVQLPHADGRARKPLAALGAGATVDPPAYHAFAGKNRPRYPRPLFGRTAPPVVVRTAPAMDVTGTLKHVKSRLQQEGYDPSQVHDPLFLRDDAARTYVPLDAALKQRIDSGELLL